MGTSEFEAERLLEVGMNMYQLGDYNQAVEYLKQGLQKRPEDWTSRLYLAMSYYRTGRLALSRVEFRRILDGCMDRELRLKAATALAATNQDINQAPY